MLDELDRELERRGLAFVHYADDCNIYVGSRKTAERVMASVTRFIEHGLELLIKEAKRTIARPWRRSLLGVKVRNDPVSRPCIADKAVTR